MRRRPLNEPSGSATPFPQGPNEGRRSLRSRSEIPWCRRALAWFERLGIRCKRLLTDNAKCDAESTRFRTFCQDQRIQQTLHAAVHATDQRQAEHFIQSPECG